jgi:hypothetical protein
MKQSRAVADPLVTIVVTSHDRPKQWIERAVQSALEQTVQDIEIVVVDDGSVEPVVIDVTDPRVRVDRLDHSRGPNGARNRGIELARGRWTTFLDDDDRIHPHHVESLLAGARSSDLPPPVAAMGPVEAVDQSGRRIEIRGHMPPLPRGAGRYVVRNGHRGRGFSGTLLVPTEVLRAVGGFDERFRAWESHDMILQLDPVCSVEVIDTIGYQHTEHGGERRSKDVLGNALALELLLSKHEKAFERNPARQARYLSVCGGYFLRAGRWGTAIKMTTRAVIIGRFQPRLVGVWLATLAGPVSVRLARWIPRKRPTRPLD